jgi:hypothetical protein
MMCVILGIPVEAITQQHSRVAAELSPQGLHRHLPTGPPRDEPTYNSYYTSMHYNFIDGIGWQRAGVGLLASTYMC